MATWQVKAFILHCFATPRDFQLFNYIMNMPFFGFYSGYTFKIKKDPYWFGFFICFCVYFLRAVLDFYFGTMSDEIYGLSFTTNIIENRKG